MRETAVIRWIAWLPISGEEDLERKLRRPEVYATKAHAFPDNSDLARCGATLPTPGEDCLGLEHGEPRGRCMRCTGGTR